MKRTAMGVAAAGVLLSLACTSKPAPQPAPASAPEEIEAAPRPSPPPEEGSAPANPAPVITSVDIQWILSDSQTKAEITLTGQNLADDASVTPQSPQTTVEAVNPSPERTLVTVAISPSAPAGDYAFQYSVPGRPPLFFTIRHQPPPRPAAPAPSPE
jgi:hypothetical protein